MRRQLSISLLVSLGVFGWWLAPVRAIGEVGQEVKYAFLVTIDSGDSRNNVIGTIRGNGSILDLVEGRDQEGSGGDTWFNRYVLKPSLIPGAPEIEAKGYVGINSGVPAVVRNEYSQNTVFWRTVEFRGSVPVVDRAFMQDYLRNMANFDGVTHIWHIVPGVTDLSPGADLRDRFVPIN